VAFGFQTTVGALPLADPNVIPVVTGQTKNLTVPNAINVVILTSAIPVVALTITIPNGTAAGQMVLVSSSAAITTLTVTATISATGLALSAGLALGGCFWLVWSAALNAWVRCQ